jgi:hypothetical protein
MSEQTINLGKDLELWYEFSSRYFDSQRNRVQDHSGYNRNAIPSGGPGIGLSGFRSFETAEFDGTDDKFGTGYVNETTNTSSPQFTVFGYVRPFTTIGDRAGIIGAGEFGNSWSMVYDGTNNTVEMAIRSDNTGDTAIAQVNEGFDWFPAVAIVDVDEVRCYTPGKVDTVSYNHGTGFVSNETEVGAPNGVFSNFQPFDGRIASAGMWTRVLNDAEIEYMLRRTAPNYNMV